jgi:hypothetical protein
MLELEIDRLKEIDGPLKNQLKKAGFNSIKDIVIRGPVEVAKSAELSLGEAARLCNNASLLLEQLGVIPNSISNTGNDNLTIKKEYIKTGSVELDKVARWEGCRDWSNYRVLRSFWERENTNLSFSLCYGSAASR